MTKVLVLYYSSYGHIYSSYGHIERMAGAVAEGARSAGAEVDIRRVPAQRLHQIGAQCVARRFSRHQTHPQRHGHRYRTMLRSLRLMNSTKGRISAWVTAALSSSSRAMLSFSPERYSNR